MLPVRRSRLQMLYFMSFPQSLSAHAGAIVNHREERWRKSSLKMRADHVRARVEIVVMLICLCKTPLWIFPLDEKQHSIIS